MLTIQIFRSWGVIPLLLLFAISTPYSSAFSHQLHALSFIPQLAPSSTTTTALCSTPIRHQNGSHDDDDDSSSPSNKQKQESPISRRDAIANSGKALASLLLASSTLSPNLAMATTTTTATSLAPPSKQTIVMTGCNSGIGFDAATRLAAQGHTVHLACRTLDKAQGAAQRIRDQFSSGEGTIGDLIPHECNLADLSSLQTFVQSLKESTSTTTAIDALCLNAGIARNTSAKDVLRTSQGFELTVGTNHFGHFYLANSLLSLVKKGGTIVVTASGVHDPESPGGAQGSLATLGDLRGLEEAAAVGRGDNFGVFDMVDGGEFDADKAYKDSKLCNVLFTREFQKRLDAGDSGIHVNCFNPGLIVSTGLFRDQNPLFTKVFDFAATDLLKVGETVEWGGKCLEYMTLDENVVSKGGMYYTSPPGSSNKYGDGAFGNQFAISEVSKEARDDGKAKRLWELSEKLVGIAA